MDRGRLAWARWLRDRGRREHEGELLGRHLGSRTGIRDVEAQSEERYRGVHRRPRLVADDGPVLDLDLLRAHGETAHHDRHREELERGGEALTLEVGLG